MLENTDENKSEYENFSRSEWKHSGHSREEVIQFNIKISKAETTFQLEKHSFQL